MDDYNKKNLVEESYKYVWKEDEQSKFKIPLSSSFKPTSNTKVELKYNPLSKTAQIGFKLRF